MSYAVAQPKSIRVVLATLMIALVSLFGVSFGSSTAHAADDVNNVIELSKNSGNVNGLVQSINEATEDNILSYDQSQGLVKFNNIAYSKYSLKTKNRFMDTALGAVKSSSINTKDKNKLFNFIADQDTTTSTALRTLKTDAQADIASAAAWYKPFSGPISTVLGVIALLTLLSLGITSVIDIAYLVVPVFRMFLDKDDTGKRPRFVSQEAYGAMQESENDSKKDYMLIYLRRRALVMFIVGLAVLYLITGSIFELVGFLFDAGQPIIDQVRDVEFD